MSSENPEKKQQSYWQAEHAQNNPTIPSMLSDKPALLVEEFKDFLKKRGMPFAGQAIDIGCGKGRNALFLASLGFHVHAVDYVDLALAEVTARADKNGLSKLVSTHRASLAEPWKFSNATFDLALDSYASIDIEGFAGRNLCRDEMYRCLKPGGFAGVGVVAVDDEFNQSSDNTFPGQEPNSVVWKATGKFQKNYSLAELEGFYAQFYLWEIRKLRKPGLKMGQNLTSTDYFVFMQKR